jgi:prepilin-type N-terminal cleavage/methylation domain-containing protein
MTTLRSAAIARRRGTHRRGYTLVEVMVALSILAIGVTGILSMENAAVLSNRRAQEMTLATNIARRWQERLRLDALTWNRPSASRRDSDLATDTQFLCAVVGCGGGSATANVWFVPVPRAGGTESAAYDAFGNEVPLGSPATRYCVNLRLTWLVPQSANAQGLIRAETRVWWYREGATRDMAYQNCGTAAALATMGQDVARLHFVYMASAITGNPR